MSTVAATNLKNASSSVNNAVTTSGGDLTNAAGVSFMGGSKNLLLNSAMQVSQRGTSATGLSGGPTGDYPTADRWSLYRDTAGTWTQDIQNDAPTGSGLRRSLRMLCTAANGSLSSGSILLVRQILEGQDVQRIAKGTASAQQLTLSFWVKSNVTGTYIARLYDYDNDRNVSASYSISASATWEKKSITFPADTTGAFDNDNAASLQVGFFLAAGSGSQSGSLQTTWGASGSSTAVGQVNLAAATNNYWQVTGVQLEVGPVATSFEFKSFGQELRECQRYYFRLGGDVPYERMGMGIGQTTNVMGTIQHPVPMRSYPTSIASGSIAVYDGTTVTSVSGITIDTASRFFTHLSMAVASVTQYRPYEILANNSTSAYIGLSAEL